MRDRPGDDSDPEIAREQAALSELRHLVLGAQREGNRWFAEALRPVGLTPAQAEILAVLADHGGVTLAELGRLIVCESGSPSRLVETLVRRGLVRREPGTEDRRVVHLWLSGDGVAALDHVGQAESVLNAGILQALDAEERATLTRLLRKLVSNSQAGEVMRRRFAPAAA
jgi:DNA-binding MarR family transcriptional regulator